MILFKRAFMLFKMTGANINKCFFKSNIENIYIDYIININKKNLIIKSLKLFTRKTKYAIQIFSLKLYNFFNIRSFLKTTKKMFNSQHYVNGKLLIRIVY